MKNRDLTVGNPTEVLFRFCLPLFGSIIFQQLYNLADSWVAGKFIGENALAAVGNSYEITMVLIAFATGCNNGCSIVVSRFFGAKRNGACKTAVSTAAIASGLVCLLLAVLGLLFGDPLLVAIKTPEELFTDSSVYLRIYVCSLPFLFFYNIANGIFSALGDSRTPFLFLACSSTANIFMDILFVTVLHGGVAGVAWATFLCQGVSAILAVWAVLRRLKTMETVEKPRFFDRSILREFVSVSIPSTLQQSFISVGNLLLQGLINSFGSGVIAGYSASVKLNNMMISTYVTISNGMSNYTAQNLGARRAERIRSGYRAGLKIVGGLAVFFGILGFFAGPFVLHLFVNNPSEEALETGKLFLRILSPFYLFVAVKILTDGVLKGGKKMSLFIIDTFADLFLRIALAFLLAATPLQSTGIWLSWPTGWILSSAMSVFFFLRQDWKKTAESLS